MRSKGMAVALGLMLSGTAWAATPMSWELRDGNRWEQVGTPTTAPVRDETLDRVERMIAVKQSKAARKVGIQWLKSHPKSAPQRDRALFLVAEAKFQEDDRIESFYYLDELMDEYPESSLFYQALQKQYEIADDYLSGYNRVFLWFPILSAEDEAIDMLYRIQQRSPGSPLAEKALLRTADYYYASSDFDLAADTYGVYAKSYPRSPKVPRVRLRQAYSNLAQFRGMKFDATPLIDARAQLVDVAAAYPDIASEENLTGLCERIDHTFAKKILITADFYRRTSEPRGAIYNYRYLINTYPNSTEAEKAQEMLAKMPANMLKETPPWTGGDNAPTTKPTGTEKR